MTFRTTKPTQDGMPQAPVDFSRRHSSSAAFKPQIWRSVRMRPWAAAGVAALVFAALVSYALLQKLTYRAESQVAEEPANARLLDRPAAETFDSNRYDTFLGEQMLLAQRLDVLTAGLETLPPSTWRDFGATAHEAAETIQEEVKVARVGTTYQMSISLKGNDPANTAAIVNAITSAYLDAVHKASAAQSDERAQLLLEERQRVEAELHTAHAEQTALGTMIGVANPAGETGNPYDAELATLRLQLSDARQAHDAAAAQLASLSGQGPTGTSGLKAAADELIAGDSGLSSMKAAISERKAVLSGQMADMTPANPVYKRDQDEIADLDRTLNTATSELRAKSSQRLMDRLRSDLERTGDVEARLNDELARQIAHATSAAPKLQRAVEIAADVQRLDQREAAIDDAQRSLRLDANGPEQVRLSLPATAPTAPEPNRKKLLLIAALPLALLFGAAAAVFLRKQDRRIYGGVDIEDVLGFPPLAMLPARSDVPAPLFEEYVLRLAAGVESAYRTYGTRTFLLTAASQTTDIAPLVTALTRKFEEIGVSVAVSSAAEILAPADDLAHDPAHNTSASAQRDDAISTESFVEANLARLKAENGLLLIMSHALLNSAQTEYVARCADATILLIRSGVTTRAELLHAAELLQRMKVTGIGAVLDEMQLRFADSEFRRTIGSLQRQQADSVAEAPQADNVAPQADNLAARSAPSVPQPRPPAPRTAEPQVAEAEAIIPEKPWAAARSTRVFAGTAPVEAVRVRPEPATIDAFVEAEPVQEAEVPLAEFTIRNGFASSAVTGPALVHTSPVSVRVTEEDTLSERVVAVGNGSFCERISPALSTRALESASSGDAGMTSDTNWLDRLLRRTPEPELRVAPAHAHDAHALPESMQSAAPASPSASEALAPAGRNRDGYDSPLASRLEEISRPRRSAASGTFPSRGTRLQIVPHEAEQQPEELVAEEAHNAAQTDAVPTAGVAVLEPEPVQEQQTAQTYEHHAESVAPLHPAATEEAIPEPFAATFREQLAEPEFALTEPIPEVVGSVAEFAESLLALPVGAEAAKSFATTFEPRPEPETRVEADPARPLVPAAAPIARPRRPLSFQELAGLTPAAEASSPLTEASVVQPAAVQEPEIATPVEHTWATPVLPEPEPEQARSSTPPPEPAPLRLEEGEFYDVEPAYQEASRNLNTGPWDPIPPLRPTWRERPSPIPPTNREVLGDRRRWSGASEDVTPVPPASQWAPQAAAPTRHAEPLPEPLLTRQWGLLSRFQQARNSGSHPAAETRDGASRDPLPGQNRNRQV